MENEVVDESDLGSGWLQVKKKHRNSSKFSLRSAAVASSNEAYTARNVGNPRRGHHPNNTRRSHLGNTVPAPASNKDIASPSSVAETSEICSGSASIFSLSDLDEKLAKIPKIKWGNLDDDALVAGKFAQHASQKDGSVTNFDKAVHKFCREVNEIPHENASSNCACIRFSCSNDDDNAHDASQKDESAVNDDKKVDEKCGEVNEIPRENANSNDASVKVSCPNDNDQSREDLQNTSISEDAPTSVVLNEMMIPESQFADDKHRDILLNVSQIPLKRDTADEDPLLQDGAAVSNEEHCSVAELPVIDNGHDESKERFRQRLWCFLFENLNRAIDELYLLCELECDMEQIEEAMLVLDEAGSDFKELKSRVERFERCKTHPSQLKIDHRRPHALSWEVRRMTTTPNRAEILSSSIEAFRKIQKQRAEGYTLHDFKTLGTVGSSSSKDKSQIVQKNSSVKRDDLSIQKNIPQKQDAQSSRRAPSVRSKKQVGNSLVQNKECPLEVVSKASDSEIKAEKIVNDKEKDKQHTGPWKPMDAWKEKRNWEDILRSPIRSSSRISHSPGVGRKSIDRGRVLHQKLMSPEKKRKTALDTKREAEDRHARAMRIRSQLENERVQRLQRTSEKLNRVNEWQAVRSLKMRERMNARHQRSESRHEAHLAKVARRAGDESSKVNEVRFITSLNEENKKLILRQKLHDSEIRRAEKLQVIRTKQKEDSAREEAVLERRKLLEAEKLQRITEMQRRKEEAKVRREEERKASSAAREARAVEQLRRKEDRARAQQEEAELLAQKLVEKLKESEQRRKFYLEQIRERASMDFRDVKVRSVSTNNVEECQEACPLSAEGSSSSMGHGDGTLNTSLKRRIKKIRQRLMSLKHDFCEPLSGGEFAGIGFRSAVGAARVKIGRWVQELQRHRQARKEGAASIGLIVADMIKYLEGKEPELHAVRKAGLIDFIASALPASHTSKPEACQVTRYLLCLLQEVLSMAANKSYFLSQNLLPPIIPMLSASLENYIKMAASSNPSGTSTASNKIYVDNLEMIAEILDGFLCIVAKILGHSHFDERQLQMHNSLVDLVVSYQIIHHLRDLFALYDRPQVEGSPFPSSILLSLNLLAVLTSKSAGASSINWESHLSNQDGTGMDLMKVSEPVLVAVDENDENQVSDGLIAMDERSQTCEPMKDATHAPKKDVVQKKPESFLLLAISETGLVSLPSLLTAVLLQANNRQSSEQNTYTLPSNFEEVATGVLKVLNNIALQDISLLQNMLARPDLQMEFFHLMSFLLSHCNIKWKGANDQVGLLLLESLLLLSYFALFHPGNQEVLRWGKNPTILHKVCDLPFVFFSDPELTPILGGTLVAACYGCEQNRDVVQQELSVEMLLTLVKSCRQELTCTRPSQPSDLLAHTNQTTIELQKRVVGRIGSSGGVKASRSKIQQSGKARTCDDWAFRHNQPSSSVLSSFMFHSRLPGVLLDKAEEFFLDGLPQEAV